MNLFGRLFRSLIVFRRRFRWFRLKDNLPVASEGLLIQRCGYRANEKMRIQLTQILSPGRPINPVFTGVNTLGVTSDGNGCVVVTWTPLAGECKLDPGQTFKIEIRYESESDKEYRLIGIFDCRGQRVG